MLLFLRVSNKGFVVLSQLLRMNGVKLEHKVLILDTPPFSLALIIPRLLLKLAPSRARSQCSGPFVSVIPFEISLVFF